MISFCKNYISTLSFIWIAYLLYSQSTYYTGFLSSTLSFSFTSLSVTTQSIFFWIVLTYTAGLIPYYLIFLGKSKARIVLRYLIKLIRGEEGIPDSREKTAILAWVVKLFFAPLMIFWLSGHISGLINNIYNFTISLSSGEQSFMTLFQNHIFWVAFGVILFLDVFFFTMGYLIETPFLKNTIKSVEPTLLGWFVALICYPPFNSSLNSMVGWYSTDFPQFEIPFLQVSLGCMVLLLMGIYTWASVSLGWKASNLTNRGIVTHGPYSYIRHPAYVCKNAAWWIGALPFFGTMLVNNNISGFFIGILSLCTWSFVYYLRAMTEEAHLSLDSDYQEYKKKVRWKFVPKVF